MKLLIIEDDPATLESLGSGLTGLGFEIVTASEGEEGLRDARAGGHDLIVIDAVLPGRGKFSVLESLRMSGDDTPVILLSDMDLVPDRIRGLDMGADDYLGKPCSVDELAARARAVLRRTGKRPTGAQAWETGQRVRIADLELDLVRHRATRAGRQLKLTPKEFALLSLLSRRRGQVLTRPAIAEQVWDSALDGSTNVVDVHVRRLRSKIDDPFDQKLVHTIRGVGYVLEDKEAGNPKT